MHSHTHEHMCAHKHAHTLLSSSLERKGD